MVHPSSTTSSGTAGTVWSYWVTIPAGTVTSTATTDYSWSSWNETSTASTGDTVWRTWTTSNSLREERHDRPNPDRHTHIVEREKARRKQQIDAENKAKQLLLDLIGQEDLDIYNKTGRLFVKGNKYDYIVQKEGLIKRVEKDKITDLCVHLDNRYKYPGTDNVIAMKLAIETDEEQVLKLANNHGWKKRPKKLPLAACM